MWMQLNQKKTVFLRNMTINKKEKEVPIVIQRQYLFILLNANIRVYKNDHLKMYKK